MLEQMLCSFFQANTFPLFQALCVTRQWECRADGLGTRESLPHPTGIRTMVLFALGYIILNTDITVEPGVQKLTTGTNGFR